MKRKIFVPRDCNLTQTIYFSFQNDCVEIEKEIQIDNLRIFVIF
jgi:hypothetical protein